jgi:hypothetical protein
VFEVPLRFDRAVTDEDRHVIDLAERLRRFGQIDHVRRYGTGFFARLTDTGFRVETTRYEEVLPEEELRRHGIWRSTFAGGRG